MNPSQNIIPIVEFDEVKFEPAVLRSKTSFKQVTRQLERHLADIIKRNVFAEEVENPRGGSEGVSSLGPLVQSFRPRPRRSLKNGAKRRAGESEMQARK